MLWSAKFGHKLRGCPQTLPLPWQVLAQLASKTSPMPEFDKDSALYFDESNQESIHANLTNVLNNRKWHW